MSAVDLASVLAPANREGYAVAGLVCLGWEDMRAYVHAAEAEGAPVILQAGPSCRAHTPLPVLGAMMRHLADRASVPVVVHLDHGRSREECEEAIRSGFTSVMFDGSALPLEENIARTRAIAAIAHAAGVSLEGEIGFVGYAAGAASRGTDPDEAERFAAESGVDAMAISVGNVHLQKESATRLDRARVQAIQERCATPLVIHGGSGVAASERADLARTTTVAKFNIGTELRQIFGEALRARLDADPALFDRIQILSALEEPLERAARAVISGLARAA